MSLVLCDVRVISVLGINVMKGLAPCTLPPLKGIVTAASRAAWIHMHTDSWPPGFNLHSRCNCRIDGHPGKWKVCPPPPPPPALAHATDIVSAAAEASGNKQRASESGRGDNDLASQLKCFPPSPVRSATSIDQSNDVAEGQLNQAQLLGLLVWEWQWCRV